MNRGGAFCKFVVGRSGHSCQYLRYISRLEAVQDPRQSVFFQALPPEITHQDDYARLVRLLCHYASCADKQEIAVHRSRGVARTHYCATLSFERVLPPKEAGTLVLSWLETAFPQARAATFLHRNTSHLHAHVWIAARQTKGRKIN